MLIFNIKLLIFTLLIIGASFINSKIPLILPSTVRRIDFGKSTTLPTNLLTIFFAKIKQIIYICFELKKSHL